MNHFADRLFAAIRAKGNALCVGLDPRWESLPLEVRHRYGGGTLESVAHAYEEFCARIIDVVAPLVPVVKPQSAFFEACGPAGWIALQRLLRRARQRGLFTILDAKRNDIASTAKAYADAAFAGVVVAANLHPIWDVDALTINPYMGGDSIKPFLDSARHDGRGVFVLVRTSNAGSSQFQDLVCDGRPVFMHVAEAAGDWTRENLGQCGYGDVGVVIGATHPAEMVTVRQLLPDAPFLVPGYGAQGGSASDTAAAFRADGLGALINSSRGIIFAFTDEDRIWEDAVEAATKRTIADLTAGTPMGRLAVSH
jgi:orotidine-5'-phosphate decarboxylase